ncbi:deoxyribose-phosphate aldolase [Micrococcales bacterium KH10]|nr:deoxyribose-phosphate aldolase [Micrococcales bacterium KH10]
MPSGYEELIAIVDHTELLPQATSRDAQVAFDVAATLGTYGCCVAPNRLARLERGTSPVKLVAVCGFPSGAHSAQTKATEAVASVRDGADEIDLVMNLGAAKAGEWGRVTDGIEIVRLAIDEAVAELGRDPVVLKVIVESAILSDDEVVRACYAAAEAGADYVKTSTGFHGAGGATPHAVELMARTVAGEMGLKASGGIRTLDDVRRMVDAGATRLGLSRTSEIFREAL